MSEITQAELKRLLHYDPETGVFTWRVARTNRVKVGEEAGSIMPIGYRMVRLDGKDYLLHRLAHLYMTGEWPEGQLDHKNNDRADNRWDNLRPATWSQQRANALKRSDNTSGYKGVSWNKRLGKWHAYITLDRKRRHLGFFESAHEAKAAYERASRDLFGEFACAG